MDIFALGKAIECKIVYFQEKNIKTIKCRKYMTLLDKHLDAFEGKNILAIDLKFNINNTQILHFNIYNTGKRYDITITKDGREEKKYCTKEKLLDKLRSFDDIINEVY